MSRPTRNVSKPSNDLYGKSAYVDPDSIDFDDSASEGSADTPRAAQQKRRPGRPRKDEVSTPGTGGGRRTMTSAESGLNTGFVDPYDQITVSRPFGGIALYNTDRKQRPKGLHQYYNKSELEEVAELPVKLVPIRIEFDIDNFHLSDTFMWNLNETLITPEHFANLLLADVTVPGPKNQPRKIPPNSTLHQTLSQTIALQIRQQCAMFLPVVAEESDGLVMPDEPPVCRTDDDGEVSTLEELERLAADSASDTLRVVIKLDLTVGSTHLRDKFEYPLSQSSTKVTPEIFARILCAEMALDPEFIPSIAHSIREQICMARLNWEDDMQAPEVGRNGFRVREDDWEPIVRDINDADLIKMTKDRDRNPRRNRRGGRRGFAITSVAPPPMAFPAPYRPSPLNPGAHQFGGRLPLGRG